MERGEKGDEKGRRGRSSPHHLPIKQDQKMHEKCIALADERYPHGDVPTWMDQATKKEDVRSLRGWTTNAIDGS